MTMNRVLVVVPCGQRKVWDREPKHGPSLACEAYTGAPFRVNRAYAEACGDAWVILSAKYGFLNPDALLPKGYNVTFKRRSPETVDDATLTHQVREQGLDRYTTVVGLGGKEYRAALEAAFAGTSVQLVFPFAGLPIGKAMQAAKHAAEQRTQNGVHNTWQARTAGCRMSGRAHRP